MYNSFRASMCAGLDRTQKIECLDVNINVRDIFREFVVQQLNGSKLDYDFSDTKFIFNRNPQACDAIIPQSPVVLCSGGIDSTIALLYLLDVYKYRSITALFIYYGAPYNSAERHVFLKLQNIISKLDFGSIRNINWREFGFTHAELNPTKFGSGYIIPLRNALLASCALLYGNDIFLTANWRLNEHAGSGDKGITFFSKISELLSQQYMQPIRVWSPFLHWKKDQAVSWLMTRYPKHYYEILNTTLSCYQPIDGKACGSCYACWKVAKTFRIVNIWDMLQEKFAVNPYLTKDAKIWEQAEKEKGR